MDGSIYVNIYGLGDELGLKQILRQACQEKSIKNLNLKERKTLQLISKHFENGRSCGLLLDARVFESLSKKLQGDYEDKKAVAAIMRKGGNRLFIGSQLKSSALAEQCNRSYKYYALRLQFHANRLDHPEGPKRDQPRLYAFQSGSMARFKVSIDESMESSLLV